MGENALIPDASELGYIPEILTAAGIQRMWGKSKNTVMLQIYKGRLQAYKDGKNIMVYTVDAVRLWGLPPKKGEK